MMVQVTSSPRAMVTAPGDSDRVARASTQVQTVAV